MIWRALILASAFAAASASAQGYQPYPYPPAPAPAYPQPGYPQPAPGYPGVQAPVLAIPVLEQDLKLKAGSNTVRFGRDSYVLTPQSQATLTAQAQWLIMHPYVNASIEGHADVRQISRVMPTSARRAITRWRSASGARRRFVII